MELIEVTTTRLAKDFIDVNVRINGSDPNYIRPLDRDINEVFDEKKNKTYRQGRAIRWILKNEKGELIGRIAAFTNKKYRNKGDDIPVGGVGFFDCINDQEAADMLFDVAKHWLLQQGMEAMDGPVNFGERDRWWGLVTKGFYEPMYCMNYNPPYYVLLMENYGFKAFFNQICFGMKPKEAFAPKIIKWHGIISSNPDFSSAHLKKNQLEKYAADFTTVYNKAWAGHGGLKQMSKEQVIILFQNMKPVMDERIILFAYHKNEPIGLFANLPDLNQWFKYLHGKFGLLQKLKFLWLKKTRPNKKFTGIAFGIVPEWQGKGIDAYIVGEAGRTYVQTDDSPYTEYEMQWIGDFHPKMINTAQSLGEVFESRRLTTYRYLFDRTKEFKRHPVL